MSEPIEVPTPDAAVAPAVQIASGVAPGWYPDPEKPGYERRWDGAFWVGTPHKAANPNAMFGPDYLRAFWTNANRILIVTRIAGLVAVAAFLGSFVILSSFPPLTPGARPAAALIALVGAVVCVAGIVSSGIGLTRTRQLGGLGVAVSALIGDVILLFLLLGLFALVAFTVV